MIWNVIAIICILVALIIYLLYKMRNPLNEPKEKKIIDIERYSIRTMTNYIKERFNEMTGASLYDMALDWEDFQRQKNMRIELKAALKGCNSGDIYDKIYVKDMMYDILDREYDLTETSMNYVIPFDDPDKLSIQDKFEIVMHIYKKKYEYKALPKMIEEYNLDDLKSIIEDGETESYIITEQEIEKIFRDKVRTSLTYDDKLHIIVQRIYQGYKGFGVVDEIRYMEIDGVSGGVSGLPTNMQDVDDEAALLNYFQTGNKDATHSVWIMYRGKTMHLSFLSFGSEIELQRICQNIYKNNNVGQLTESKGFIANDMKDQSRIVVMRPPFSESWVFFNRKFNLTYTSLENFVNSDDKTFQIKNADLPIKFLRYMMKGARMTALTGDQGTGKSTAVMAMVKEIYGHLTLRIQEMIFELHLRKLYPLRNIVSNREINGITGQQGLDISKKTDGAVNIVGEVASDDQVPWIIQAKQVSKFTIFTHHAQTFEELVGALRNAITKSGMMMNEATAEEQIVKILHFNVHLYKDEHGHRYIQRITECVPLIGKREYSKDFQEAAIQFFERMTDRRTFEARDIIVFENGEYIAKQPITEYQRTEMLRNMTLKDRSGFESYLEEYWKVSA